jgi:dipeptidyl aminopeptidase/acylaminoacyl peptidase
MKRLILLNLVLVLLLSSCSVITSSQAYVDGQPVDAPPTPEEVLDPVVTDSPTEEPVLDDLPIPVETGDYQTGGFYQNWIAFEDPNTNIALVNPVTGEIKPVTQNASSVIKTGEDAQTIQFSQPAWSSDGEFLAFKQFILTQKIEHLDVVMNLWVYDPASETSWIVLEGEKLSDFSWIPGSHSISYTLQVEPGYFTDRIEVDESLAHGVMQVDVKSGEISELVAPQGFSLVRPNWAPDGSIISFDEVHLMEGRGNFAWFDVSTSTYHRFERQIGNYSWSPGADVLAYDMLTYIPSGEERIMISDRMGDQEELFSSSIEEGSFAFYPRFSPNGAQLAYVVGFGSIDQVDKYQLMVQAVDSSEASIMLEGKQIETYSWSGDGSFLAASLGFYGSSDIVIIDVLNGTSTVVVQGWNPVWQNNCLC